jgi:serine/threonine-protein kinase
MMPVDEEDPHVLRLLEEALGSGRPPEQVCADRPDLLPVVRAAWERCRRLDAQLGDLFPSARPFPGGPVDSVEALPSIPGYAVEALLGRGGVGVVYRARHLRLNRPVALKTLLSGAYAGRVERARFHREAEAVAALRHPNVVQVYEVGEHGGRPYFTMELMDNGSLAGRLAGTPQPAADAAALVTTLARAVEAAHAAGIVHRDLKPANVLLAADGTPKVSDFGLALQSGGDEAFGLTLSGTRLGTPSYMAPEQAAGGSRGAVGPAADVYALGAILYELLTGRPPFRGESAAETERQVIADEPAPPRRLNTKVPRDLETICLKCLGKEPARRYATAAALADDLGRFVRGEPIAARPVGRVERGIKWVRRRPAVAAAVATAVVAAVIVGGGSVWVLADRAAVARDVAQDLDRVAAAHRAAAWDDATAALVRATARLGDRGPAGLRARLAAAGRDADLVRRLARIRSDRLLLSSGGALPTKWANGQYAAAFLEAGLGDDAADAQGVAARVAASDVRPALVGALYEWMRCAPDARQVAWLEEVTKRAAPDPTGWRDRALDPATWRDPAAAAAAEADPGLARQPVELLLVAYERMEAADRDPLPFLRRVRQAHPLNFWANLELGLALRKANELSEAIRYIEVASVLRPESTLPHVELAEALRLARRFDEALARIDTALGLDPQSLFALSARGAVFLDSGRTADGLRELEACLQVAPHSSVLRSNLGIALDRLGRHDEAIEQHRRAVALEPTHPQLFEALRDALVRRGRWDEVLDAWRVHLDVPPAPRKPKVWGGYAELCLFVGRMDEYRRVLPRLLDEAERSPGPQQWEVLGRACLLSPPPEPELRRATALIDRALDTQRENRTGLYPYFRLAKGLAEYRAGRYASAIAIMEGDAAGALHPAPRIVLAMARWRAGQQVEARRELARLASSFNWSPAHATGTNLWMIHVLRREAGNMILPDLPAFLEGRYQPRDNLERLGMAADCQAMELHVARASLWSAAIDADPALAASGRGHVVPPAALAGQGVGKDAHTLSDDGRRRWRERTRQWIRDELDVASGAAPADPGARDRAKATIRAWSTSGELAGVRDPAALARLPEVERREWAELWERAAAVAGGSKRSN